MDLEKVMQEKVFAVVGDTLNEEKYACIIKHAMQDHGYTVYPVGKELASLNDIPEKIDIIDLCINPVRGLALMKECRKPCKGVVIQPGAGSETLKAYLEEAKIPYIDACLLVGLSLYAADRKA